MTHKLITSRTAARAAAMEIAAREMRPVWYAGRRHAWHVDTRPSSASSEMLYLAMPPLPSPDSPDRKRYREAIRREYYTLRKGAADTGNGLLAEARQQAAEYLLDRCRLDAHEIRDIVAASALPL